MSETPPIATSAATAGAYTGTAPVLVVDDDAEVRSLVSRALRRDGLAIRGAATAEDAMAVISSEPVSVVVCDLRMPGMSGIEFVRSLRADPATSTLPVLLMTGSGDRNAVVDGLDAGADDFVAKPIRLDELVARVRAHLRTHTAWSELLDSELRSRADAAHAIGQMALSGVPEEVAEAVVDELVKRTGVRFVSVLQRAPGDRLKPLAQYTARDGTHRGGSTLPAVRSRELLDRARDGPWSELVSRASQPDNDDPSWTAELDVLAGAPVYAGDDLVALLSLGAGPDTGGPPLVVRRATLLASAIDFASVLSAVAGPAIADRRQSAVERDRLRRVLARREFFPVYQPIVALESGTAAGYEALTRFVDGVAPDVRFAEAAAAGLGTDFQLAALRAATESAVGLPPESYLSLNISPDVVVGSVRRLAEILRGSARPIVLEVTEHERIADYAAFRRAVAQLREAAVAVDDAGAGYASLRHILELRPAFAKLDMSLVRGIDGDPLRQGLAAGLAYFAARTGCQLIAEGVERQEEAETLRSMGVQFAQGYLFGRPEPRAAPA